MSAENFLSCAKAARKLAAECLEDAKTATTAEAFHLIAEHDRHIERAEDYEMRASWSAPKPQHRRAA